MSFWDIQKGVKDLLKTILVGDFQQYYQKWECLHRCVAAQGITLMFEKK